MPGGLVFDKEGWKNLITAIRRRNRALVFLGDEEALSSVADRGSVDRFVPD
jgi:hypothetical protein